MESFLIQLYRRLKDRIVKVCGGWYEWALGEHLYSSSDPEDIVQTFWLAVADHLAELVHPEDFTDDYYIEYGMSQVSVLLDLPRMWTTGARGVYVDDSPGSDRMDEDRGYADGVTVATQKEPVAFTDQIEFEVDLERYCKRDDPTGRLWRYYYDYGRHQMSKRWFEGRDSSVIDRYNFDHETPGWTQEELAEIFSVDQSTISRWDQKLVEFGRKIYGVDTDSGKKTN